MIEPHGGKLINRILTGKEREESLREALTLKRVQITSPVVLADIEMIAIGSYSPLKGFMDAVTYESTLEDWRLGEGLEIWPLPITLPLPNGMNSNIIDEDISLWHDNVPIAILERARSFQYDKQREAMVIYGTINEQHPGVDRINGQRNVYVSGDLWLLNHPRLDTPHDIDCWTPQEMRDLFAVKGWKTIVGFQTRNPIHRAHEYITKCALEICDGLLVHPLIGHTVATDVPAIVRNSCYRALLSHYYPTNRIVLSGFPAAMRYAGPREAVFHAIVRKNYGCSHFIVGRDHAGYGNFYDPYAAQRAFDRFTPQELGITPLFFENAFYCEKCLSMATVKTCPHDKDCRISMSGTQIRRCLAEGKELPPEMTRPEVASILNSSETCKWENTP